MDLKIKTLHDGSEVSLSEVVSKYPNIKYRVGCDSLNVKDKTVFITTLVGIHPEKSGAFILYGKEKIPRIEEPQVRLWIEVEKAIEFSAFLRDEHLIEIDCIDFDLNPDVTYESSRLVASAIGYAESMGFKAYCKPDSIFAIYAADFIVHKGNDGTKRKGLNT
jgi:predicted RNase H-related nuclease YkuK (DUF458 family)